jgi:protein-tyrosine-phosphatase
MAEALFRQLIIDSPLPQAWRIESAGTWASEGSQAAEGSRAALAGRGLYLDTHRSRPVNRQYLKSFNLILTMEKGHKEALQVEFPEIGERVFMLSEMAGISADIADPIGGSADDYLSAANQIENYLKKGFDKIVHLAQGLSLKSYEDSLETGIGKKTQE